MDKEQKRGKERIESEEGEERIESRRGRREDRE